MILRIVIVLVLLAVIGAGAWVRLAPLPVDEYHRVPLTQNPVGDWPEAGGFEAVRQIPDPRARLAEIDRTITATPRTTRLEGDVDEGLITYVTRSAVWGFPDITNIWVEGDRLHIRSHLVFGRSDFGVNRARIERWLALCSLMPAD